MQLVSPQFWSALPTNLLWLTVRTFLPTIGTNGIIAGQFNDLLQNGQLPNKNITFMLGNNRDEGVRFAQNLQR